MKYPALAMAILVACLAPGAFAARWNIQYFYDEVRSSLAIEDLAFPSAQHGIAVGTINPDFHSTFGRTKHVALVTSDGGAHWTLVPIAEQPRSLFFLNESTGWMVTDGGIWFTGESGRSWKKISEQRKADHKISRPPEDGLILRVCFLDPKHGFAVGLQKTALETHDGGHTWKPIPEAAKPAANPAFTAYTRIVFDGPRYGLILGGSTPPRADDSSLPAWMEPERAAKRRQVPSLTILLQTFDGGATWKPQTAPLFGVVTSLKTAGNDAIVVLGFNDSFEWPSEVHRLDAAPDNPTNQKEKQEKSLLFRESNRRVTDAALFPGPRAFLAAIEPSGRLNSSPVPGKVKILTSSNLTDWTEMDVDYKAVARSLVMAGPDPEHLWGATDTGMILHLTP